LRQNYLYFEGREGLREMSRPEEAEMCILCRLSRVMEQKLEITFRQRTDNGDVFCRVAIHMHVCPQCGFKCWDDRTETVLDAAVRQAYEQLV